MKPAEIASAVGRDLSCICRLLKQKKARAKADPTALPRTASFQLGPTGYRVSCDRHYRIPHFFAMGTTASSLPHATSSPLGLHDLRVHWHCLHCKCAYKVYRVPRFLDWVTLRTASFHRGCYRILPSLRGSCSVLPRVCGSTTAGAQGKYRDQLDVRLSSHSSRLTGSSRYWRTWSPKQMQRGR